MDIYAQMVVSIIKRQETIIGPVAIEQAEQVDGLSVDWAANQVSLSDNPDQVIDDLVETYKSLFGQVSVEVSKEAVASLIQQIPEDKIPSTLR